MAKGKYTENYKLILEFLPFEINMKLNFMNIELSKQKVVSKTENKPNI